MISKRNFKLFLCGVVFGVFLVNFWCPIGFFFGLIDGILLKDIFPLSKLSASSETQGQSVELGEKAWRKLSSTGGRAPGYRLSPDHFQMVKWMLAPDWAQKMLCIIVPNRGTASPEFFSWVRTRRDSYWLDHSLSGSCTKQIHAVRKLSDINSLFQNTGCLYTRLLSKT